MNHLRNHVSGLRNRLLAVVIVATAAALAVTTAGFNLVLDARLDSTANDVLRSRIEAELNEGHVRSGRLVAPAQFEDGTKIDQPVWLFAGTREVERPANAAALTRVARTLADGPARRIEALGGSTRLQAEPIVDDGRRVGTIVAAVSMGPYERTRETALAGSIIIAAALLIAAIVAAHWIVLAGLRPVARMTAQAAEWSENDLDRRFGLGPPRDELTQLAATLDGLLGRLAAALRREQRFSAELSHELRTPLTRMRAQAQLALADDLTDEQREAWTAVLRSSDEMAETLEALLAGARAEARAGAGVADARRAAEVVAQRFGPIAAERDVRIVVEGGDDQALIAGVDTDLLERLLQPLVDNACRYATSEVTVTVGHEAERIVYEIADDGPGVREEERERIFEPAVRGSAGTAIREGTGLGLALARRLARAAGGDVEAVERPDGGGCFVVRVPRA